MTGATTAERTVKRRKGSEASAFDKELAHTSPAARWREWMMRVEAVIFASVEPVSRETLAQVVGSGCSIDLLIDDLREELRDRPYEIVFVAGGFQHRTRASYAPAIRAAAVPTRSAGAALSQHEAAVIMAVGYFQPVTRGELSKIFGKEISRDTIAGLKAAGLLASGPRSPAPGAPYTYVTTKHFLSTFGFETLRDLPDIEALEDAGLLNRYAEADTDRTMDSESGEELIEDEDA
ncbi:SMC-Scp complex subunit ScpB [Ciceribacter thiooxidans]|uniref:SMC-Scp complex subunit ScpB n=1 Tax=Ciceribacter thiooxidans TaxID=1969821 RepID=A0ABV7I877_9HYPH|nr:SMC-Scp complex subunit ScpB [Ciceribacter thiooxidans]